LLILDPWGISFHAVVALGLGKNLLFKSILARCGLRSLRFGPSTLRSRLQVFGFIGINIVVINVINVGLVLGIFRFGLIYLTVVLLFYSLLRYQMPNPRDFFDFFLIFFLIFSVSLFGVRVKPLGSKIGSNQLVRSVWAHRV